MKRYSGLLAAGLMIFVVLACNLSKNSNNSNNSNNKNSNANRATPLPTRRADADVFVNKIYMAKDDGGNPGDETESFSPGDRTIHCVVELNKAKKDTDVRFIWRAVDVGGRSEDIKTIDYSTKSFENKVRGHLTLPKDWPAGKYRVEVHINGTLDKTIDYTIE
ncbi:MAG: hypothetical protein ACXW18_05395 [Pyrinomonadaceae bacterium]